MLAEASTARKKFESLPRQKRNEQKFGWCGKRSNSKRRDGLIFGLLNLSVNMHLKYVSFGYYLKFKFHSCYLFYLVPYSQRLCLNLENCSLMMRTPMSRLGLLPK